MLPGSANKDITVLSQFWSAKSNDGTGSCFLNMAVQWLADLGCQCPNTKPSRSRYPRVYTWKTGILSLYPPPPFLNPSLTAWLRQSSLLGQQRGVDATGAEGCIRAL